MCRNYTKHALFVPVLLAALPAFAQNIRNGENAPYSRFGIGEQKNNINTLMKGMGSISGAYASQNAVNTDNPASYSSLRVTTYEAGGEGSTRTINNGTQRTTSGMASVSYLNIGIPVGKHAGIAVGLKPMNRVYYSLNDTAVIPGYGQGIYKYDGGGSLNYGFIGAAGRIKGFSVGVNFGYVFGTIDNVQSLTTYDDTARVQNTIFLNSTQIGGIYWKGGALYQTKFNEKLGIRIGGTVTLSQDLKAKRDVLWMSQSNSSTSTNAASETVYATDTVYSNFGARGNITLPASYNFGVHLVGTDKWMAGVDFTTTQWNQYRGFGNSTDSVTDRTMKIAVGGEYTPNPASIRQYIQRVTYRLGFYYGQDYVRLKNTDINYYAVTAGVSLPFKRTTDRLHAAIEVGKRGNNTNGLLQENFVKFSLGMSLNDRWFIKRKYE